MLGVKGGGRFNQEETTNMINPTIVMQAGA